MRLYDDSSYIFLDVRTKKEHNEKAIPNSILIPLHELDIRLKDLEIIKNKKVMVFKKGANETFELNVLLLK